MFLVLFESGAILPVCNNPPTSTSPPIYALSAIPTPPVVVILPVPIDVELIILVRFNTPVSASPAFGDILTFPFTSTVCSGALLLNPVLPSLLILTTVGVKFPLRILTSILDPLVLCCIIPVSPSIPKLSCPPVPILMPSLLLTLN